jgi:hypothetical protein
MVDTDHMHRASVVIDPVDHSVGPSTGGVVAGEFPGQRFAHNVWLVQQRPSEKVTHGHRNG